MAIITKTELTQDNIAAFGHAEAAKIARKQGILFSHHYGMAFGTAPRPLKSPPTDAAKLVPSSGLAIAQYAAWLDRHDALRLAR